MLEPDPWVVEIGGGKRIILNSYDQSRYRDIGEDEQEYHARPHHELIGKLFFDAAPQWFFPLCQTAFIFCN